MNVLCIVPCSSKKIWDKNPNIGAIKAREAYIGPLSKKAIMFAEKFCNKSWIILSAKYGFLNPDDIVLGPYNVTFSKENTNPITIDELIKQAHEKGLYKYDIIVVLTGREYAEVIRKVFPGKKIIEPLRGLKYGKKLRELNRLLSSKETLREIINELSQ